MTLTALKNVKIQNFGTLSLFSIITALKIKKLIHTTGDKFKRPHLEALKNVLI